MIASPRFPESAAALPDPRRALHVPARSFRIAPRLIQPEDADDAAITYALCREADDLVDQAPSAEVAAIAIAELRAELRGRKSPRPLVIAFYKMALRRKLPIHAMWDLVDTLAEDAGPVRIADDAGLLRHAYGVAGTVGLLMGTLLGASGERAEACAVDLGIGMQLSNIVRDVAEDALRDRVYLPATRLHQVGLCADDVVSGSANPAAIAAVCADLVALSDSYYASARNGLRFLPARGRVGVFALARPTVWAAGRPRDAAPHRSAPTPPPSARLCPTV